MKQEEKTYIQGFNDGYRMKLYNPELFEKIKESLNQGNEYDTGLVEGATQADKEKEKKRLSELQTIRSEQNPKKKQEIDR